MTEVVLFILIAGTLISLLVGIMEIDHGNKKPLALSGILLLVTIIFGYIVSRPTLVNQIKLTPITIKDNGETFIVSYSGHQVYTSKDPGDLQTLKTNNYIWEQYWRTELNPHGTEFALKEYK